MSDILLAKTTAAQGTSSTTIFGANSAPINTTGATMLVAALFVYTQSSPTPPGAIQDSQNNTWTLLPFSPTQVADGSLQTLAYCFAPSTSATHTFQVKGSYSTIVVYALEGTSNALGSWSSVPFGTQSAVTTVQPGAIAVHSGDTVIAMCAGSGTGTWSAPVNSVNEGFALNATGSYYTSAILLDASAGSINPTFSITPTGTAVSLCMQANFTQSSAIPAGTFTLVQEVDNFALAPFNGIPTLTTTQAVTKGDLLIASVNSNALNYTSVKPGGAWQIISDSHNAWIPIYGASQWIELGQTGGALPLGFSTYGEYSTISAWYCIAQRTEILSIQFFNAGQSSTNANVGGNGNSGIGPVNNATYGSNPYPLTNAWCQLLEFSGNSLNPFFGSQVASSLGPGNGSTAQIMIPGTENCLGVVTGTAGSTASGYYTTIGAGWSDPTGGVHPDNSAQYLLKNAGGFVPMGISTSGVWQLIGATFLPNTNPKYTLSGSLGSVGAGAQVTFISTTTLYPQYATANASGNYSISLDIDTYYVVPEIVGQLYTPTSVTISTTNVTQNFTATACNTNLLFTTTGGDNFTRADQNPAVGYTGNGTIPPGDPLPAILNNQCVIGYANASGTVTTSGTAVTWVSGPKFMGGWAANLGSGLSTAIVINGVSYNIASVTSETALVLTATAGVQSSPVSYSVGGVTYNYGGPWSAEFLGTLATPAVGPNGQMALTIAELSSAPLSFAAVGFNLTNIGMVTVFNLGNGTATLRASDYYAFKPSVSGNLVVPQEHPVADGTKINQPSFTYKIFPFALGDTVQVANIGQTFYILHNGAVIANYINTYSSAPVSAETVGLFAYGQLQTDVALSNLSVGNASQAYSISGSVGVAGVTVSYTGTSSGSVVSGVGGAYAIPNLANGTYTITPTLAGYTFSPTNAPVTVLNANVIQNFTATSGGNSNNLLLATNLLQVTNAIQSPNLLLTPNLLGGTNDWS